LILRLDQGRLTTGKRAPVRKMTFVDAESWVCEKMMKTDDWKERHFFSLNNNFPRKRILLRSWCFFL